MEKKLMKILNGLKQVKPDPDYSRQSRLSILNTERKGALKDIFQPKVEAGWLVGVLKTYSYRIAFAGAVVVLLVLGTVYYVNNQLSRNNFVVEASEINASIQIKLNEIRYLLENRIVSDEDITAIQSLLGEATGALEEIAALEGDMDESLEKIKSAKEALNQIDVLLMFQN